MDEAVRTVAPTAAIWVIVIVMSILAAFMVTAPLVADITQARAGRRRRLLMTLAGREPVVGAERDDDAELTAEESGEPAPASGAVPAQRSGEGDQAERSFAAPAGDNRDEPEGNRP